MSAVSGAVPRSQTLSLRQLVRRQVAGEVAALRAKGIPTVTFQPTADDLAVMVGDTMDPAKASTVCAQVAASTLTHLRKPDVAERLGPARLTELGGFVPTDSGGFRADRPEPAQIEVGRLSATQ